MPALLLDLGWKSALIAGLALIANHLLRRRAAGERVALLRAALAALLLLPVLALAVPALELAVLPALEAAPAAMGAVDAELADAAADLPATAPFDWVMLLYGTVAALLTLRLAIGLGTLWRWTRTAAPVRDRRWTMAVRAAGLRRPVRLLVSPRVAAPVSWGLSPAWVLIGPATERRVEQAEAVIAHELAHVRRFDWPVLMAAQLATFCFWFNPLVWLLTRELARQTELAADEEAIHHVARVDYAQTLLSLAGGAAHPAGCGMSITHSALGKRICCVLDGGAARPASRLVCAILLIGAPLAATPLAAMQLVRAVAPAPAQAVVASTNATPALQVDAPAAAPRTVTAPATSRARGHRSQVVPKPTPRRVIAEPSEAVRARQTAPRRAQFTPPLPPQPMVPGPQAAAWKDAMLDRGRAQAEIRARSPQMHHASVEARKPDTDVRDEAKAMADAAKALRVKAQDLERVAADGNVAKEIRGAHARAAGSLRNQAERLDMEARRKLSLS